MYLRDLLVKEARKGRDDESAVSIPDITLAEMEALLHFLYFGYVHSHATHRYHTEMRIGRTSLEHIRSMIGRSYFLSQQRSNA